jgi:hypothetical protein
LIATEKIPQNSLGNKPENVAFRPREALAAKMPEESLFRKLQQLSPLKQVSPREFKPQQHAAGQSEFARRHPLNSLDRRAA